MWLSVSCFQVDYVSRQLQRIYKLHAGAIWSLTVSDAFCTTASEDGYIRCAYLERLYMDAGSSFSCVNTGERSGS